MICLIERKEAAFDGVVAGDDPYTAAVIERAPVCGTYRGYEIIGPPPPGSAGLHVAQMLNILEGFDLSALEWGSAEHLHLLIEAKKLAFEDRARYYADPAFAEIPVSLLLSADYSQVELRVMAHLSGDPSLVQAFARGEPGKAQVVGVGAAPLQQALRVRPRHRLADVAAVDLRPGRVQRQLSLAHERPPTGLLPLWRRRSPGSPCSGSSCRKYGS